MDRASPDILPDILVVIVNYRTAALTIDCLRSLAPEIAAMPGVRAVVLDNASGDGSDARIPAAIEDDGFAAWCDFVAFPRNGGFAFGNNEAVAVWRARHGGPDTPAPMPPLIWLLNPDTRVLPGAVSALARFMSEHPGAGIAGGRVLNEDRSVRPSAFGFHTPVSEVLGALNFGLLTRLFRDRTVALPRIDRARPVDWVSGASMMIRGSLYERLGGLDDGYFMYFEETDFCLRAKRLGSTCWHVPESEIIHLVGQSSGVTGPQAVLKRRPKYWFDSRIRYFRRNHGALGYHLATAGWLAAYPLGNLFGRLRGRPRPTPKRLWRDFVAHHYFRRGEA